MFITSTCRSTRPGSSSKLVLICCTLVHGMLLGLPTGLVISSSSQLLAQDAPQAAKVLAQRLVVPLPIVNDVDSNVKRSVLAVLDRFQKEGGFQGEGARPILVLEFRPREGTAGESSEFDRSYSLARFLTSDQLRQVRTVAYLPKSVQGHSLLPVLGCQQIIMAADAQLGAAGISDEHVDPGVRLVYENFADRRRVVKPAVVLGMLDRQLIVYQVTTPQGPRYVLADELEQLKKEGLASEAKTIIPAGDLGLFTGKQLRLEFGFVSHLAANEVELAEALEIPASLLSEDPSFGGKWRPVRVNLEGRINNQKVARLKNEIRKQLDDHEVNFVCLWIDSPGGSLAASVDLANYLAELDSTQVKTVAFINQEALADAALPALACDEMVMVDGARLGGPGEYQPSRKELKNLEETLGPIAQAKGRNWSLMKAMVAPKLQVFRYQRADTGEERYLCRDEWGKLKDQQQWLEQQELSVVEGLLSGKAQEIAISRKTVQNLDELKVLYQLPDELELAETPRLTQALDRLVAQPWFVSTLLFFAFLFLMSEISAPGLGIPGFMAIVCFLLFFWAQFLNGTAGWLEVLLFVSGIIFVALEIFVIPGLGIFGIGGGVMIVGAIIMASQTFVVPRNSYQLDVFMSSLLRFVLACGGVIVVIWAMIRFFPNNFWFRQVVLAPLSPEELAAQELREEIVSWKHLIGEQGMTSTPLVPAGKVRIGHKLIDVVSDGDMIEKGIPVVVAEVKGNRVVVRQVESP
ncbi:MAG TPA: hypothetical protein EYN03_07860 [Planctomycetes bacterium]|nr:hypothetical protein [Planctomycetota bacterium]